jgi:hypothetical protein
MGPSEHNGTTRHAGNLPTPRAQELPSSRAQELPCGGSRLANAGPVCEPDVPFCIACFADGGIVRCARSVFPPCRGALGAWLGASRHTSWAAIAQATFMFTLSAEVPVQPHRGARWPGR